MNQSKYSMIMSIVNRGYSENVMGAAKKAGARGGTIINGRGTGAAEAEKIFGVTIEPEKEIVLIITENVHRQQIMLSISKEAGFLSECRGFTFSLPVEEVIGTAFLRKDEAE